MRRLLFLLCSAPLVGACSDDGPTKPQQKSSVAVDLAVGQAYTTTAGAIDTLRIEAGAGAEYVLVPFFADTVASTRLLFDVQANGVTPAQGPPNPASTPFAPSLLFPDRPEMAERDISTFEAGLRRRELAELPRRVVGTQAGFDAAKPGLSFATAPARAKEVGDTMRINVRADSACTSPVYRTGRVAAITQRAVVVADLQNPLGGFSDADYRDLGVAFDTLVWPVDTQNFGEPTDIDGNGRVILFYTSAVNDLTKPGADAITLGFFFGRDLFPRQDGAISGVQLQGCQGSNSAEMFYMLVPDLSRGTSQAAFSKDAVKRGTVATLGHEFQHLINASRRLFIVKASGNRWLEDVWLNEGLSHIAEELLFYRVSGLAPRQNIKIETLRNRPGAIDAFNAYGIENLTRFITYLEKPDTASLIGKDRLPTRGASWAFLRYAADRKGGDQQALWRGLVNSDRRGVENLNKAFGVQALDWMQDWTASVYADDAGFPVDTKLTQPSWDFRSLIGALRNSSGQASYPQFPLHVTRLGDGRNSFEIFAGGGAFARFGVGSDGRAEIRLVQPGSTTPVSNDRLRVSIVRTR